MLGMFRTHLTKFGQHTLHPDFITKFILIHYKLIGAKAWPLYEFITSCSCLQVFPSACPDSGNWSTPITIYIAFLFCAWASSCCTLALWVAFFNFLISAHRCSIATCTLSDHSLPTQWMKVHWWASSFGHLRKCHHVSFPSQQTVFLKFISVTLYHWLGSYPLPTWVIQNWIIEQKQATIRVYEVVKLKYFGIVSSNLCINLLF